MVVCLKFNTRFLSTGLLLAVVLFVCMANADKQKEKVNCEDATRDKCENSLSWEEQCTKECGSFPNVCTWCQDKMYFCDTLKHDSGECDDWEIKALCLKTCGECHCGHAEL